jgi:hypothetical protein
MVIDAPMPAPATTENIMLEKLLPKNEGNLDRILRILVGLVLLALIFVGPKTMWGLIGIVPLATGLIGSCPLYTVLGLRTCPMTKKPST